MLSAKGYVPTIIKILKDVTIKIACAGRLLTCSNLLAPTYWDTIDDMALRVCPNIQISIDKKADTIPTAAKDSVAFTSILPTIAASVKDKTGSDIPEISAGIASLLMFFRLIKGFKYDGLVLSLLMFTFAWNYM